MFLQPSMPRPVALSVFLTYAKNPALFDKLTVKRVDNTFRVKYYDAQSRRHYFLTLTNTSLGEYVRTLCEMFLADNDPFLDIQFNFHGFPTFMATQETFKQNYSLRSTLITTANIVSESFFADAPEGVYCDDDDEMPPLIPLHVAEPVGRRRTSSNNWDRHY